MINNIKVLFFYIVVFAINTYANNAKIIDSHEVLIIENSSQNTVVFENGLMAKLDSWQKVTPYVEQNATLFLYNRYGYGKSKEAQNSRDGETIVNELRELLKSTNIKPPYILVGHSLGGLYMQYFANRYPNEVKALILVDSTHPQQFSGDSAYENWPSYVKFGFNLVINETEKNEFENINKTGKEALKLKPYGGNVWIISSLESANDSSKMGKDAHLKRKDFINLYPNAKQILVDCGHNIPMLKPEIIIDTINEAKTK